MERPGSWLLAGRGLRSYMIGLGIRFVLGLAFLIGSLVVVGPKNLGAGSWLLGLIAVGTGFAMLQGLGRFSRQPVNSPGRKAAKLAATILAITVAIELICVLLAGLVAMASANDGEVAGRFAAHAGTLWRWATALWIAHVGATIVAMWKLEPLFADSHRKMILPALVLVAGICVFVTWNVVPGISLSVTPAIIVTGIFVVASMAMYAAALDDLSKKLRAAGTVAPTA